MTTTRLLRSKLGSVINRQLGHRHLYHNFKNRFLAPSGCARLRALTWTYCPDGDKLTHMHGRTVDDDGGYASVCVCTVCG